MVPRYTLNGLIHSPGKERDAWSCTISWHNHHLKSQAGYPSNESKVSQARETRETPEHPNTTAGIAAPSELWGQGSETRFTPSSKQAWVADDPAYSLGTGQRLTPCLNLLLLWPTTPALSQLLLSPRRVHAPTAGVCTQI